MNIKGILPTLIKLLNFDNRVKYIVQYGKTDSKHDLDLMVVLLNEPKQISLFLGCLDLFCISESNLLKMVSLRDPIVTEPILTGRVIFGNKTILKNLKRKLHQTRSNQKIISYLFFRCFEEYFNAHLFLKNFQQEKNYELLRNSLINLSFAISYFYFAKYYFNYPHRPLLTLKEIKKMKDKELLLDMLNALNLDRSNFKKITPSLVKGFMQQFEFQILTERRGN